MDSSKYYNINEVEVVEDEGIGDDSLPNEIEKLKRKNKSLEEQLQIQSKESQNLVGDLLKNASEEGKKNLELTAENKKLQEQNRDYREIINVLRENEGVMRSNEMHLKVELNNVDKISFGVYQENEHLKSELSSVNKINLEVYQDNERLKDENEQLKKRLEQLEQSRGREKEEGGNKKIVLAGKILSGIFWTAVIALFVINWIAGAVALLFLAIMHSAVLLLVSRAKSKSTDNQIQIKNSQTEEQSERTDNQIQIKNNQILRNLIIWSILRNSGNNYNNCNAGYSNFGCGCHQSQNNQSLSDSGINYNNCNAGYPDFDHENNQSLSDSNSSIELPLEKDIDSVNKKKEEAKRFSETLPRVSTVYAYDNDEVPKNVGQNNLKINLGLN